MFAGLNWLAILVSTIVSMILGFLWYGPLFGKAWMKEVRIKEEDIDKKDAMKSMVISIVGSFISFIGLAIILKWVGGGLTDGILAGLGFGFAFVVTYIFSNNAYEGGSLKLSLIHSFYRLLCFAAAGALLVVW